MRTNRKAERCAACGSWIEAGDGTLTGPPWRVYCADCFVEPVEEGPRAIASLEKRQLVLRLDGYLGSELFGAYRAAIVGARFRKSDKTNVAPLSAALAILAAVGEIDGLDLVVEKELHHAIAAKAEDALATRAAVDDRLVVIDKELADRGEALYGYQRTGIPWLAALDEALLADDCGLGKSVQALMAAPPTAPILVVAPAVAKGVWTREVAKWRPDLKATALKGRKSFRWPEPGELVVTNYEILPGKVSGTIDLGELPSPPSGCVLIADEAHKVKNSKAAMTKKLRAIARRVRAAGGRVWLLTATPLLNRPPDLWALLVAAGVEKRVYPNFPAFADAMGGEQEKIRVRGGRYAMVWKWGVREPDEAVATRLAPVMLRRVKGEVLDDLPPKRYQDLAVNGLDRQTQLLADAAWEKFEAFDLEELATTTEPLPHFEEMSAARAALAASKIPALEALAEEYEESDEPLVVFSAHRAPVEALGERDDWAVITGETPATKRTEIEESFQAGELRGIAATIKAGGVAITLTRASHAIFVDSDWVPTLNQQAEDRIYRIGQSRGVLITRLVADHPLDRHVTALLEAKQRLLDATVNAARRGGDEDVGAEALAAAQATLAQVAELALADGTTADYEAELAELEAKAFAREAAAAAAAEETAHQQAMKKRADSRSVDIDDLAGGKGGSPPPRRGPVTEIEEWAAGGLGALVLALALLPKYWRQIGAAPADVEGK